MQFFILASGSKGNCILVRSETSNILIDCGISIKKIKEKLNEHDLNIEDIDAVLITHGHSDHVKNLKTISKITKVYLSKFLCNDLLKKQNLVKENIFVFTNKDKFYIKDIFVQVIPVLHDCIDPVGFILYSNNKKIGIFTDIGEATKEVLDALDKCNVILIESNHDIKMLKSSDRPKFLKDRILYKKGHLSNIDAGRLLSKVYDKDYLEKVVLMHLSEDCNCPKIAVETVIEELKQNNIEFRKIEVAKEVK